MTVVARRSNSVGTPMLVNIPHEFDWKDTGEGGLAFFFLVPCLPYPGTRQVCLAGGLWWPQQDAEVSTRTLPSPIDGGLLVGSTGQSLWSDTLESYFEFREHDLNEEGAALLSLLRKIYGEYSVELVTLLDT